MATKNLSHNEPTTRSGRRYIPKVGDIVIGVVGQKSADYFRVDIGSPSLAVLSNIAFNSASKRHRPNLKQGHPIICHVISTENPLEIQLSCEDPTSQRDWVTSEVYFGPLAEGGLMIEVPLVVSEKLSVKNSSVFNLLGQYLKPFESCVGVNGRVYVKSADNDHLRAILIAEILTKAETTTLEDIEILCKEAERRIRG